MKPARRNHDASDPCQTVLFASVTSMQATISPDFWAELKRQRLIEQNAPTPG
jgi:hypothetical protein